MLLWLKKMIESGTKIDLVASGIVTRVVLRSTKTVGADTRSNGMIRIMSARKASTDSVSETDKLRVSVSEEDGEADCEIDADRELESLRVRSSDKDAVEEAESEAVTELDGVSDCVATLVMENVADKEFDGVKETDAERLCDSDAV